MRVIAPARDSLTRALLPLPESACNLSRKPVAQLPRQQAQLSTMMCLVSYEIGKKVDQISGKVLPRGWWNSTAASDAETNQLDHSFAATRKCAQQLSRSNCTTINQARNFNAMVRTDHLDPHAPGVVNVGDNHSHRPAW